jgi:hypothetical protein
MSRIIDTTLVSDVLIESCDAMAISKYAPLKIFAKDFSEKSETYANGKVKSASIAFNSTEPTVSVNPTTFGNDESTTVDNVKVDVNLLSVPIMADWSDNVSIKQHVQSALNALIKKMVAQCTGLFTKTTFGTAKQIAVDVNGADTIEKQRLLMKQLYKGTNSGINKYLIGDTDVYANALPSDANGFNLKSMNPAYGFDGVFENSIWADGVKGIVTDGRAVAMVARTVQWDERLCLETEPIYIPELDLTVSLSTWGDQDSRAIKGTLDIAFGAALYDKSATKVIVQNA